MFIQTHECRLIKPIEKINQHKQKQADNYKKKTNTSLSHSVRQIAGQDVFQSTLF